MNSWTDPNLLTQGDYAPHVLVEAVLRVHEYLAGIAVRVAWVFADVLHIGLLEWIFKSTGLFSILQR